MLVFSFLLFVYFISTLITKRNKNLFLLVMCVCILIHSLFLYTQYGYSTGGSDEDFYVENALALNLGWDSFISLRDYLPSSYYAYSIFVHWVSFGIDNEFLWLMFVRLSNAIIISLALMQYRFDLNEKKTLGSKIAAFFIYAVCLWLVMFNFRDTHILAIILSLYAINYIYNVRLCFRLPMSTGLLVLLYYYKPEIYVIIFTFPIVRYLVGRTINKKYISSKIILIFMLLCIPITFINLPPPIDYLALRMVYNSEVDINQHTQLQYDPVSAYNQGNTTIIGKTIFERVYKRFPIIFVGYNPIVMLFDYTKSFNPRFGINLSVISYVLSQLVFFVYYFILNPILIALLTQKRIENDTANQHLVSLFIVTVFYYSLYNVLQGSAQPRVTIPLTVLLVYSAYYSGFIDLYKKRLINIIIFVLLPIMITHYIFYALNLIN